MVKERKIRRKQILFFSVIATVSLTMMAVTFFVVASEANKNKFYEDSIKEAQEVIYNVSCSEANTRISSESNIATDEQSKTKFDYKDINTNMSTSVKTEVFMGLICAE